LWKRSWTGGSRRGSDWLRCWCLIQIVDPACVELLPVRAAASTARAQGPRADHRALKAHQRCPRNRRETTPDGPHPPAPLAAQDRERPCAAPIQTIRLKTAVASSLFGREAHRHQVIAATTMISRCASRVYLGAAAAALPRRRDRPTLHRSGNEGWWAQQGPARWFLIRRRRDVLGWRHSL
jgi:hypothetical protein